jgi:DNA-binding protein HU-beta
MAKAKPMTKARIVAALAEQADIPKKTSAAYLQALAEMAYREAKNGFTIPGVGKLVIRKQKARTVRHPQTGQPMEVPERRKLKFLVSKTAREAVLGSK